MGYYSLRDYDGFTVVPEDEQYQLSQLEAEARGGNSLVNSFKMSRIGNEMSLLADEESQLRTSDDPAKQEAARLLRSRIRTLRDESGVFATAPQRYEDVRGVGDAASYVAGQVGQAVGSSIDQMATGSAMGIASGVAGLIFHPAAQAVAWGLRGAAPLEMYRQNKNLLTGEAYNEIADDPVAMRRSAQDIRDEVSQHGYRAALLDTLPQLLPVGQISGVAGKALGRIPTSAKLLGAAVGEGLTETGQQYSQQQAHSALNPERDTSGDMSELINSGLGGFIGGGAMGGMGHVGEKMWARGRTEGDGQNGDVIDLNAPTTETKPEVTLNPVEQLRGKPGKFNDRESRLALVAALEGLPDTNETPEDDMRTLGDRRDLLVEHLKKIRGNQAADLLTLIEAAPFDSPQDRYNTLTDKNFVSAVDLVKRKNKLTDADLAKRNAENRYAEGFWPPYEFKTDAVPKKPTQAPATKDEEPNTEPLPVGAFKFESAPDMFADLQPEEGAPHGSINDRSAANKARYEEAQQKAKLFNTRSELVANRLWRAYTDEHGYNIEEAERDAGPAGDIQRITYERVRRDDPGAVDNIRDLTSEIMAISTIDDPTPEQTRRADRVAERAVALLGQRAGDQLADIQRITGGGDLLRKVVDHIDRFGKADTTAGLQAQFDDRDAAAQELVKMIPAEVEARLLKEHGIDLSSNKDRNDILDLMEDVADGKTSVPRIKLTKLFTRRVVDAMEGYLGNTIMPRMAGVRDELIDENDSSGGRTQATNADDVHDTEITAGDFRDIAEDGADEVDPFDAGAAEQNHSAVTPESMVYHWAGTKKATVKDFTKAWDRNDEGRLPKLLHPGDDKMLERVQTLAGLAAERLGDQRDRYVIGNPLAKDPIEAAGGTSAKKLMDRAGMSDDKRTQLMLEYMQQEDKSEKFDPTEANDVVNKIHFLTKIDDELTDVLVNHTSIGPYGKQLSTKEKVENRGKPLDIPLDRLMPLVPPSDAAVLQKLFDSRKDVNARVSNETLMTTVAPIVHRAKQLALDHMKNVVPGVSEFIAENPGAELKDFVNNYFSQRYAVVAEQPTDRDYLQLSPTEFKDMATRGAKALKSVYNDVGTDEAAQTVARAGRNVIHFESPHAKSGVVSIPAHALVEWVRDGRNAHTTDKNIGEASRGSQRSQHESYRDDLGEGISALMQNGLVTGLPWIVNAAGEREDFAPGETKTVPSYKATSGPLTERQDYKPSKAQNYFVTEKGHAIKDGWRRVGVGELPPSLDLDGISVKEYNEQRGEKAYAQKMQTKADNAALNKNPELIDRLFARAEEDTAHAEDLKDIELSQDPIDVQGEKAVDEAIRVAEGSQTRKDEREHIQLMTSVMRAAADHLPGALTVKGAVNKAASVAGNVWKTYMADPEAGLARMAGYIRSVGRGKHSGDFEGQKAFQEIWNEYHAAANTKLDADNAGLDDYLQKAVEGQAQSGDTRADAVGGPHYALPLAAILTPRNLEAARPQDKPLMLDMRARVAATIQALWAGGKIDSGQVRKLVNHLSGFTDATLREKQDKKVPPNSLAQIERRNAAKVEEGFVPNAKVRDFLNGLVKGGNAAVEIQDPGTGFQGGRYHTAADPVGGDKTKPLAVSGPVRGQGSTLAEREAAAAAAPAVGVAGGRATVKNLSLDYKGGTVDHDAEIAALEAEYIARGIPKARKVEPKEPSKVAAPLLKNPPSAPVKYQPKETAKLLGADRVIAPVSTEGYAGDLGRAAQAEGVRFNPKHDTDMSGKVVLVSVPGKGRGFTAVDKLIEHVKLALDRGATVLTDNEANATRPHNAEGEGVLRQALIDGGYTEAYTTEHFSAWQRVGTKEPRQVETKGPSKVSPRVSPSLGDTPKADLSMHYADGHGGDHHMRAEFAGRSTMDLIESGDRTATTRSLTGFKGLKKGDVFTATGGGRSVLLRATTDPYRTSEVPPEEWSQLEGWAPSVYAKYNGAWQMRFEKVNGGEKHTPSSPIQAPGATKAVSVGVGSQTYWARYSQNNYEVSTQGDKRFSALNAKLKDGRTIEEAYQLDVKGYRAVGDDWRLGKGKPPLKTMTAAELFRQYKALWQQWAGENPELIAELREKAAGKVLTDRFASTPVSQARALAEILNETSPAASEGVGSQNTLGAAIAKHQEYLKNPPADYTTERAAAIGTWAAKQHARVVAELAKTDDSTDQYDRLDELRFKLDQLGKASAAKVAESTEAEEHERKYGPQGSVKRNAEDSSSDDFLPSASDIGQRVAASAELMSKLGFNAAPERFADVAAKLLTDPRIDPIQFMQDSAKALSYMLVASPDIRAAAEREITQQEKDQLFDASKYAGEGYGKNKTELIRGKIEAVLADTVGTAPEQKTLAAKLLAAVKEFMSRFFGFTATPEFAALVRQEYNRLVSEPWRGSTKAKNTTLVNFQQAVNEDPQAANVLATMSKFRPAILTGSVVLATEGSVYRQSGNLLHDLDFIVNASIAAAEKFLYSEVPNAVRINSFQTNGKHTDTYFVPPPGATVKVTRQSKHSSKISKFEIYRGEKLVGSAWVENGVERKVGERGTIVDFFTGGEETHAVKSQQFTVGGKQYSIPVASAAHIFDAKLGFGRKKDVDDYRRFEPSYGRPLVSDGVKRNAEALTEEQAAAQFDQLAKMSAPPPKHIQVTSAIKHFERTLGDKVKLILQDSFPDMKIGSADYNLATNVARIATANPPRIMRLAYHESVHGMFNTILNAKGMEATKEMLYRAASEPKMYARLKEMLKEHPNALKDMENDMEERVAYMFQFSKLGMLTIDKKPETFFEKVQAMMRRVFGAVRDSEKALAILTAFDEGGLKEPSAAGQVIAEIMSRGEWHKKLLARFDAQSQALYTEVMAAHNVFRNSESATAQMLGKLFYTNPGYGADTERVRGVQEGVINRTQFKRNYYSNRINDALRPLDGPNMERDLKTLAEALNSHTEPTSELVRNAKNAIGKILNEFRSYAKSSGLDLGKQIGADKRYWPRVYEIEKLINGKDDFVNMLLTKHGKLMRTIASTMRESGKYPGATEQDAADAIHQSLVDRLGVEDSRLDAERDDGVLSPYFASQNERKLDWLSDEDVKPFLSEDVTGTLTQYISQGVRAVEYTKMFGERGQSLKEMLAREGDLNFVTAEGKAVHFTEDGPILRELKEAAEDQKIPEKDRTDWVERRFEDLKRASGAMEGSLGKDISAGYRKFQAGMMTYQIIRLLPLMIFSSMLDPNGIRVAGGDWDDMFNAYKRGFVGLWTNWKDMFLGNPFGSHAPDELELAALAAGVINSDAINEERGDVHSSEYSSGTTRRINHAFFKAIGITQWDRDMRIMATAAARKAIVNHYNNTVPEHSARWLREVGLKRSDVYLNDKGELIVSAAELMKVKKIKNVATAQKMLEPTHFAVNRWVSRAIVSPNAGLRPTRASDPHYAMFFQFKSFTYAFQETTMRYALHEAQNGNRTAALQLLRGVPIMIAADMTKAMVTGGGSLPGYMANWTLLDWIGHGINRAGLTGTGSFATDILSGNISGTLAGPSVGHAFSVAGDLLSGDVGGAITQSLPGVKQMNFMHG